MAERTEDVQAHWTRPGVLARIDAALTELGHDPQNLSPEILATLEHLHSGGLATTRRQANRIAVTEDSRVLDVGCGIGGPARYLAHTYGCRVDGIDLTPELIETGRVLTERCKLADRVVLQVGNALDLPYPDQTFDVVWCQNVATNISDKAGLLAGVYRVLKPGGLFTSTEYSVAGRRLNKRLPSQKSLPPMMSALLSPTIWASADLRATRCVISLVGAMRPNSR